jgi:hypothetical protein
MGSAPMATTPSLGRRVCEVKDGTFSLFSVFFCFVFFFSWRRRSILYSFCLFILQYFNSSFSFPDSSPDYSFARWIISGDKITGIHLETNASAATQPITKEVTFDAHYDCQGQTVAVATSSATNTNVASSTHNAEPIAQPKGRTVEISICFPFDILYFNLLCLPFSDLVVVAQAKRRKNIAKALMNKADPSMLNPKKPYDLIFPQFSI